jgi:diguanylate cyclase (GGDEF)-like protein
VEQAFDLTSAIQDIPSVSAAQAKPFRIVVADDEESIQNLMQSMLTSMGYEVGLASNGKEALQIMSQNHFDLVFADIVMPVMDGVELLVNVREHYPRTPVIMITGYPSVETAFRLVQMGATDCITKPFTPDQIAVAVERAVGDTAARPADDGYESKNQSPGMDTATGVYNFVLFCQLLDAEVAISGLRSQSCSLLMAETHDPANTPAGHGGPLGDDQLGAFAETLRQVSGPTDIIGRTGQREFAILMKGARADDARGLAERVRQDMDPRLSLSAGIACAPQDSAIGEELIRRARKAMKAVTPT